MAAGFSDQRQFTWRAFRVCLAISLGAVSFGYPTAIIGTTLSQPSFLLYMRLLLVDGRTASNKESLVGAMSGLYQAGAVVGVLMSIPIMDSRGRRQAVAIFSLFGLLGAAGCCAAVNIAMFLAFRFITGMGAWGALCIVPVYISELAPPKLRGLFVTLTGVLLIFGQAVASWMGLAFNYVSNNSTAQWRGPLGIQILFPVISFISTFWIPESPRWLLMQGRVNEARDIVMSLHSIDADSQSFAIKEFYQMTKQADYDRSLDSSWKVCFTRPSYRRRFEMCCMYGALTHSTGVLLISAYGSVLYSTLGYGARDQMLFQCGYLSTGVVFNIIGDLIVDKVGRKVLMIVGMSACTLWMTIETVMVARYASPVPENPNKAALVVAVAALYLFIASFTATIETAGFTFYAEVFPNHLRAKGVSAAICAAGLVDLVYLQVADTAFKTIGWKYFLVFIVVPAFGIVYMWWRYPETGRIPLEEVARHFGDADEVMVFSENMDNNAALELSGVDCNDIHISVNASSTSKFSNEKV